MSSSGGYSWQGVLEFLYNEHQSASVKENLWFLEKKSLNEQIRELEGKMCALEAANSDLKNRNSMLEHALRQIKFKGSPEIDRHDKDKHEKDKHDKDRQEKDRQDPPALIPQRRPRPNKAHLTKVLCSLGLTNLLEDINKEVSAKMASSELKIE